MKINLYMGRKQEQIDRICCAFTKNIKKISLMQCIVYTKISRDKSIRESKIPDLITHE